MTIKNIPIESNIPIEDSPNTTLKKQVGNMEVGDSIFLPNRTLNAARSHCWRLGALHEIKLIARKVDDGVRIWRVR
jgi:hypothetical protein